MLRSDLGKILIELYVTSKLGMTANSSGKYINKPYFIFIVKLCNDLNEASKTNDKVETYLKSIPWQSFFSEKIAKELEQLKSDKTAVKKTSQIQMETETSYCDRLFEAMTKYNYTNLAYIPGEELKVSIPEIEEKK